MNLQLVKKSTLLICFCGTLILPSLATADSSVLIKAENPYSAFYKQNKANKSATKSKKLIDGLAQYDRFEECQQALAIFLTMDEGDSKKTSKAEVSAKSSGADKEEIDQWVFGLDPSKGDAAATKFWEQCISLPLENFVKA